MLVPQPQLAERINAWKLLKSDRRVGDVTLEVKDVMSSLVDLTVVNPEILDMLMEVCSSYSILLLECAYLKTNVYDIRVFLIYQSVNI